jgi:hypothetical protein
MLFNTLLVKNISKIVSKLTIFLFILGGNFVGDLYSCSLRYILNEYMFIKHILGIFIMIFFVGLLQEDISLLERINQSFFLYAWYIFIMRSPVLITIISIIIICIIYFLFLYIEELRKNLNDNKNVDNKNITTNKIDNLLFINNSLFIFSFVLSLIGTIYSFNIFNKYSKLNIIYYILGSRDQECFNKKQHNKFIKNPLFFDTKKMTIKNQNLLSKKRQNRKKE